MYTLCVRVNELTCTLLPDPLRGRDRVHHAHAHVHVHVHDRAHGSGEPFPDPDKIYCACAKVTRGGARSVGTEWSRAHVYKRGCTPLKPLW